ncbi:Transglutaminase-like superfamily protein [Candidatus Norongarragalina meridionalis]|nr:Transglutaminase-like superfamily protein [Candidatus Norongarragalina meridionalis]
MRLQVFLAFALLAPLLYGADLEPKMTGSAHFGVSLSWVMHASEGFRGTARFSTFAFSETPYQNAQFRIPQQYSEETDSFGNKRIAFSWNPEPGNPQKFEMFADVSVDYSQELERIAEQNPAYLQQSEFVILDGEAASQALEIVGDAPTRFEKAVRLADWVYNNVEYDVAYWDRQENSSTVLKIRRGVCDEKSHLLMAFLRSVGIPSRMAAGFVYSGKSWGPHAWVEADLGDGFWTPIDATFNEFRVIDATHLRFAVGRDQGDIAEELTEGLLLQKPAPSFDVESQSNFNSLAYSLKFSTVPKRVGPGSSEKVAVEIQSTSAFPQAVPVSLAAPQSPAELAVRVTDAASRLVYLPPNGDAKEEWNLVFPTALQPSYVYNFTLEASTMGSRLYAVVEGRRDAPVSYSQEVSIEKLESELKDGMFVLSAVIRNRGNVQANPNVICVLGDVSQSSVVPLTPGEERAVQFAFPAPNATSVSGKVRVVSGTQVTEQPFVSSITQESVIYERPTNDERPVVVAVLAIIVVLLTLFFLKKLRLPYRPL